MTYAAHEYSTEDGLPMLRFLFTQGNTAYRYTTETEIVADSNGTFLPAPISISDISQTNEMAKDALKITLPRDHEFARLFIGGVPEQITFVFLYRGHANDIDEEYQFAWRGRVAGASADVDLVTLECENIFTSLRRPGLRARYQRTCRHALYQQGCGVLLADFLVPATALTLDDVTLTVSGAITSNSPDGYFVGGMVEKDGFFRYIVAQADEVLTLISPFQALGDEIDSTGTTAINLYPGCAHSSTECLAKFDNLDNFGGFPWIPSKNPFGNDVTGSIS